MSNAQFNTLITLDVDDNDRIALLKALDVLVANVLKMQPGPSFWQQRIIPGHPFVVANNENIDQAIEERGIFDLPSVQDRLLLQRVAATILHTNSNQRSNSKLSTANIGGSISSSKQRLRDGVDALNGCHYRDHFVSLDISGDVRH